MEDFNFDTLAYKIKHIKEMLSIFKRISEDSFANDKYSEKCFRDMSKSMISMLIEDIEDIQKSLPSNKQSESKSIKFRIPKPNVNN